MKLFDAILESGLDAMEWFAENVMAPVVLFSGAAVMTLGCLLLATAFWVMVIPAGIIALPVGMAVRAVRRVRP